MQHRYRQDPSASGSCALLVPTALALKSNLSEQCRQGLYSLSGCVMLMLCAPSIECIGPILTDLLYHYFSDQFKIYKWRYAETEFKQTQKNLLDGINGAF